MIDYIHLKYRKFHYLDGDETLIENYSLAAADQTQTWVCHHRRELVPDRKTIEELVDMGLYWNRPPEELIFLTNSDHIKLHSAGVNNPMSGKSSWEKCTPEQRADRAARYAASMKGKNVGRKWWQKIENDKLMFKFAFVCPGDDWQPSGGPSTRRKSQKHLK